MRDRHTETLKLSLFYFLLCVLVVIAFTLLTGCATTENRQIKGALTDNEAHSVAVEIAAKNHWRLTRIDNTDKSNGDYLSDHSYVWYTWDWDGVERGALVISRTPDGDAVIHPVKAGDHDRGFLLQGTHNGMPDDLIMTRALYVGTYVGHLTSNGK